MKKKNVNFPQCTEPAVKTLIPCVSSPQSWYGAPTGLCTVIHFV